MAFINSVLLYTIISLIQLSLEKESLTISLKRKYIIDNNSSVVKKEEYWRLTSAENEFVFLSENFNTKPAIPITNYKNVQYYGTIGIGSGKQELTVNFDTGSTMLWLPADNCLQCRKYGEKFKPSLSSSYLNLTTPKSIDVS